MLTIFEKKVLTFIKKIPRGRVLTYVAVACAIGHPRAVRAVGNALNKNPNAPKVPCHRIVKANGEIGGYARGAKKKVGLLKREGIQIADCKIVRLKDYLFEYVKK